MAFMQNDGHSVDAVLLFQDIAFLHHPFQFVVLIHRLIWSKASLFEL
jgi:hypothetical protein